MKIEDMFNELGIQCREYCNPNWLFTNYTLNGKTLYISGHTPTIDGVPQFHGKVGAEVDLEKAKNAAVLCLENCLGAIKMAIDDLDNIKSILKVNGYVASNPDFVDQAIVINAVSEPLYKVFGTKHARAALGVAVLPGNVPVEIELIVELK
ncbi:MAG: RidA family protein [Herbinix sp.]|nr:RidA family protein [Herbinix sp.]